MNKEKCIVNFDNRINHPLIKKFHMFNSGLAPIKRYEENIDALERIRPESIRIDLFLGDRAQEFGDVVDGDKEHIVYKFEKLDYLAKLLLEYDIKPYWCWCYIPIPLQPTDTDFKHGPTDFVKFGEILKELSAHYVNENIPLGFQEVFNEADCYDNLYAGTFEDYLKMYEYGAPALKEGDENSVVGGPAEAFYEDEDSIKKNMNSFIQLVLDKKLPLDYFSYHSYGYEKEEYLSRTLQVQSLLAGHKEFISTELHMNELNVIPPLWEYGTTCLTNSKPVPIIWECISKLLTIHDLTVVHWAQLINSGVDELSLISLEGIYYPAFYCFEIYARMPVERCYVTEDAGINGLASRGNNRCSAVFWNNTGKPQHRIIYLKNLKGDVADVYILDEKFYAEAALQPRKKLEVTKTIEVKDGVVTLEVNLDAYDMIYIETNGMNSETKKLFIDYGRQFYFFHDRKNNDSYAYFERRYNTAYLGSGNRDDRLCKCSAIIKNYPECINIKISGASAQIVENCVSIQFEYMEKGKSVYKQRIHKNGLVKLLNGYDEILVTFCLENAPAGTMITVTFE